MTDKQLEKLIEELNANPTSNNFIITQIAEKIYFGNVWFNLPWIENHEYWGNKFYFINKSDHEFIGIIEACSSELHVYLKPEYRNLGIMSNALKNTVIPHMFLNLGIQELKISIDQEFHGKKFNKVEKSALHAGFKNKIKIYDYVFEYFAYKNDYPNFKHQESMEKPFTEDEFKFLHERINSINAQLQYMKERYELFFNEEEELISNIKRDIVHFEANYDKRIRLNL